MAQPICRDIADLVPGEIAYVSLKVAGLRAKLERVLAQAPDATPDVVFDRAGIPYVRVTKVAGHVMVTDGTNRTKAASEAGLTQVPCVDGRRQEAADQLVLDANVAAGAVGFEGLQGAKDHAERDRLTRALLP